jgi:hypothetical protein
VRIHHQYILISHNSDQNIDSQFLKYIDTKIIHWFAQNVLCSHEKITPIPIGIHLRIYDSNNTIIELLKKYASEKVKASAIYYAFSEETNTKRSLALQYLKTHPLATGSSSPIRREDYYININNNAFNASPEGGGVDCHRTWESMYLKSVPILERNTSTEYWEKIGLPVYLIDSWTKIDTIDSKTIEEFYKASVEKFNSPALYMEYWIDKITQHKHAR